MGTLVSFTTAFNVLRPSTRYPRLLAFLPRSVLSPQPSPPDCQNPKVTWLSRGSDHSIVRVEHLENPTTLLVSVNGVPDEVIFHPEHTITLLDDRNGVPDEVMRLYRDFRSRGFIYSPSTITALMIWFAQHGSFLYAQELWNEIINSSFVPSVSSISNLMDAYGKIGQFDEVLRILHEVTSRNFQFCCDIYVSAISCFGRNGQLDLMEDTIKGMASKGFQVDSVVGNSVVKYYSTFASLTEMESSYMRLKKSRILIEEQGIRAVASAYIREGKLYRLGKFLKDVGLGRRKNGNLLWNLLLLSYAANFKMKSLQREFMGMLEAGFDPDLTTFNIRALAFSKMCMIWDLHLSIEHMKHKEIVPDLVTYGCLVDAYIDRRLGKNLYFALKNMNMEATPLVSTDPIVFEAFGKGGFHSCSESLLESNRNRKWTYSTLIKIYLKRTYRTNQIFWNY